MCYHGLSQLIWGSGLQAAASTADERLDDLALGMFEDDDEHNTIEWPEAPAHKPKAAPLVGPWGSAAGGKLRTPPPSTSKRKGLIELRLLHPAGQWFIQIATEAGRAARYDAS